MKDGKTKLIIDPNKKIGVIKITKNNLFKTGILLMKKLMYNASDCSITVK
jgi:hypothetical protein